MDRVDACRPETVSTLSNQQHALSHSPLGPGASFSQPHPRSSCSAHWSRLAREIWTPGLFTGDVCGTRTISRNLLSGCQLESTRSNPRQKPKRHLPDIEGSN